MNLFVFALLWVAALPQLGNIAIVKGTVKISHQVSAKETSTKTLPPGYCKTPVALYPTDRIEVGAGGFVKGTYDGLTLLKWGPTSWTAPEKGKFSGKPAARSLLARKQMGTDSPSKSADRLALWPVPGKVSPLLYVDSEGEFDLAWIAPERAATVTITVIVNHERFAPVTAPAHSSVVAHCPFGWIENKELGLMLRRKSQEDEATPVTIELRTDTGQTKSITCQLVARRYARQWDDLVSRLQATLKADQGVDEAKSFEAWNDLLLEVEQEAPLLRGYWILKLWSLHPDGFITRDAVRQLAEESGQTDIVRQFSK